MSEEDPYAEKRRKQSDEKTSNVATLGDAERRNTEALEQKMREKKSSKDKK